MVVHKDWKGDQLRYIEVTHKYVLPVRADDVEAIDAIASRGISVMEEFMRDRAGNITDLRSDWTMMPSSYRPVQPVQEMVKATPQSIVDAVMENQKAIDADLVQGNGDNDVDDPPLVAHPWDQGLRVTPPSHGLFDAETEALRQEGKLCGHQYPGSRGRRECVLVVGHPLEHLYRDAPSPEALEQRYGNRKELEGGE